MEQANIDGIRLEYEVSGPGEPVVYIDGALIADTFRPLLAESSLSGYQFITYHRRGYAGSSPVVGPLSIAQQAADCRALLAHLGVKRAHVVGHSLGGAIALQLALDAPDVVHSLALLEPALMIGESAAGYREALVRGRERYREVGAAVAVEEFLRARWPGYQDQIENVLPGAMEQAIADAGTSFEADLAGLLDWQFGEAEARRIRQPTLSVLGGKSEILWPRFGETHRALLAWLPDAAEFVLPGATHFMQVENPSAMADGLAAFFARHPITT